MGADPAASPSSELYCPTCEGSFRGSATDCPHDGTRLVRVVAGDDELVGRVIDGRFELVERIGAGGMATVYRAVQCSVGRQVAVKLMRPGGERGVIGVKRFLREARLLSRLDHPNVVTMLDFGQTSDGLLYLAMELLRGRTLSHVIRTHAALPLDRFGRMMSQLCDALEAAHKLGIVHCDLTAANAMILDEPADADFVKVLDFGLSKSLRGAERTVTHVGTVAGTPDYVAPEVLDGSRPDERSDLYALGVLAGRVLGGDRPPLLQNVLDRLLAVLPEDRIQSARQAREAFSAAIAGTAERAPAPRSAPPGPTPRRAPPAPAARPPVHTWGLPAAIVGATTAALVVIGLSLLTRDDRSVAVRDGSPDASSASASASAFAAVPAAVPAAAPASAAVSAPAAVPAPAAAPGSPATAGQELAAAPMLSLEIDSRPASSVEVAGRSIGRTPARALVPRGEEAIVVTLRRPGYRTIVRRVVPDGSTTRVRAVLERTHPRRGERFLTPP